MWGKKRISGRDYDLGHLDPFPLEVTPKVEGARTYLVRVSFGSHTFTREMTKHDKPDLAFRDGRIVRAFCVDRYVHSIELPAMIRYASKGRVYFSEHSNFLIVESLVTANAPYVAFFKVERAEASGYDVTMFVTSAHLKPALPDKLPAVTFATLIDHTAQGKPLVRPEPRRIVIVKRK